ERLLRGIDGEHVVAGVHVQGGSLLVEAHELDAGRAVLEQVDAALVVVDRGAPLALVPERRADLAVQVGDARQVLLGAVIGEAALPDADRAVDATHAQRDVSLLLADAGHDPRVERLGDLERGGVAVERPGVRVEGSGSVAGRLQRVQRLALKLSERVGVEPGLRSERRGAGEVLGDQADDAVAAIAGQATGPMTPSLRSPARPRTNSATSTCFRQRTDLGSIE